MRGLLTQEPQMTERSLLEVVSARFGEPKVRANPEILIDRHPLAAGLPPTLSAALLGYENGARQEAICIRLENSQVH
jgi:hypothetical protein